MKTSSPVSCLNLISPTNPASYQSLNVAAVRAVTHQKTKQEKHCLIFPCLTFLLKSL